MRAPFQILAIPYRITDGMPLYCVFRRADYDQWQFIAGGGEDDETPVQAAKREIFEESGIVADSIIELKSLCHIPVDIFPKRHLYNWAADTYVVPEYSFGFICNDDIKLSHEHTEYAWLTCEEALKRLQWDSNRTALYELNCRLS
ncbi:MAG: NUDIX pyrophosphatase [Oscillospiraceae bacterium]|nr:NUDIX pyrophosphatase [Oscillospiraceae bacterium]